MAGTLKAVDSANLRGEIAGALVYTFCRSEDLWQSRWGRKPRVRLPVDRALRPPGFSVPPPDCSPGRVPMKRRSGGWSAESPFPASVTRCRRCRSSVCLVVFWRGPKAATTRGTPAAPLRQRRLLGRSGPGRLEATLSSDGTPRSPQPVPGTATRHRPVPVLSRSAKTSFPGLSLIHI